MSTIIAFRDIVADVTASDGHRYGLRDNAGNSMDTLKVIARPMGGYLGVYHTGDHVKLADSSDLVTWTFRRTLDPAATQPTIRALPAGDFLTAVEYNNQTGSGGRLRLRYYPDIAALYAGEFTREHTIPRTLSACNEGTPTIDSVSLRPDIDNSTIDLGFHYQRRCDLDRQAVGTLTGFSRWSAVAATDVDDALSTAAAAQRHRIKGNIGGRDSVTLDRVDYTLFEVQYTRHDFRSWRIYLRTRPSGASGGGGTSATNEHVARRAADPPSRQSTRNAGSTSARTWEHRAGRINSGRIEYVPIITHRGSTAFANPTVTSVVAPSGRPAIVVTLFLPSEAAGPGEAGELLYYRDCEVSAGPAAGEPDRAPSNE